VAEATGEARGKGVVMSQRRIENEIEIACPPERVYDYVTQPWCWHEWHPSSQSAVSDADVLSVGDTFDEVIRLQPLSPLPLNIHRKTHYRVVVAERGVVFEVRGETGDGGLTIHYSLVREGSGTRFRRTLTYEVRGLMSLIEPLLLYPRMKKLSAQALANLKAKLEQASGQ
jgi:carbon monoxide dehydrogenase subunit G